MIQDNGDGTVTYKGLPLAALTALRYAGPIAPAVDDYLLMEREARAWDAAVENFRNAGRQSLVDYLESLVHPAQDSSAR